MIYKTLNETIEGLPVIQRHTIKNTLCKQGGHLILYKGSRYSKIYRLNAKINFDKIQHKYKTLNDYEMVLGALNMSFNRLNKPKYIN